MFESLKQLQDLSLQTLFTKNTDRASVAIANDAELAAYEAEVAEGREKDILSDWWPVIIRFGEESVIRLLGIPKRDTPPFITSEIEQLDLGKGLVITASGSLYRLTKRGQGETIPQFYIWHLAAVFWLQYPDLAELMGVPRIFY